MKNKYFIGLIIALLGIYVLLTSLNLFQFTLAISTVVLTILFLIIIFYSLLIFNWFLFFFFLGFGFALLADDYGFTNYNFSGIIISGLLIGAGIQFIVSKRSHKSLINNVNNDKDNFSKNDNNNSKKDIHFNNYDKNNLFINNRLKNTKKIIDNYNGDIIYIQNDFGKLDLYINDIEEDFKLVLDLSGDCSLTNIYLPVNSYIDVRVNNFLSVIKFEEGNNEIDNINDKFLIKGHISLANLSIYRKN
ncbi:MAG: hypothetical protein LBR40_06480 [Bacilli bacterium]|jgi:predicted membrane protein|nr:hypothetical protein [Bacilli bacterium]